MVKNINSGSSNSDPSYLTAVGNTLYFQADDGINGVELWKSDGTASGTVMVKNINSGGDSIPQDLTVVGNTIFFRADDGINGEQLWKSDGTSSGTALVKDINRICVESSFDSPCNREMVVVGETVYFQATANELWKSDGTASGTVLVKDFS